MNPTREKLKDLRTGLLRLHKELLESEQHDYELSVERVNSPGQWLGLVIHDPRFAWLRELSALIVRIDEALDSKDGVTWEDAQRFIKESRSLLTPSETGQGFGRSYWDAMQRDPDVIIAHATMGKVLARIDS